MKRRLAWTLGIAVALLAALAGLAWTLLDTQAGLRWALAQASARSHGALRVAGAEGRLAGPLTLRGIEYRSAGTTIALRELELDWSPRALLAGTLRIDRLVASGARVALPASTGTASAPSFPALPLAVRIVDGRLSDVKITRAGGAPLEVRSLALKGALRGHRLRVTELALRLPQASLQAHGVAGLAPKLRTTLDLAWQANLPNIAPAAASGTVRGTWAHMVLEQRLSAPLAGTLKLELDTPLTRPSWRLALDLPRFALREVSPAWGNTSLAAHVDAHGSDDDATLEAQLHTDAGAHETYRVELGAKFERDGRDAVRIDSLHLRLPQRGSELNLDGELALAARRVALRADWKRLAWPLTGKPEYRSDAGSARLRGTLDDYQLTLDAGLAGPRIPDMRVRARADGDRRNARIAAMHAALLGGSVDAHGTLAWRPAPAWDLALRAQGIDPGKRWKRWPGRLDAQLASRGRIANDGVRLSAELASLSGSVRGYPVRVAGKVKLARATLQLERLRLVSGEDRVEVDGRIGRDWDLDWRLDAPRLGMLLPGWQGALSAQGHLGGPRARPQLRARVHGARLAGNALRLAKVDADVDASLEPERASRVSLHATDLEISGERFRTVTLEGNGTLARQVLSLRARGAERDVELRVDGGWQDHAWHGRLAEARVRVPILGEWALTQPVELYADAAQRRIARACWQQAAARLCVAAEQRVGRSWTASAALTSLPWARLAPLLPPDLRLDGTLSGDLQASRAQGKALQAQLQVSIPAGTAAYRAQGERLKLRYGGGELRAALDAAGLDARASLRLQRNDRIAVAVQLPGYVGDRHRLAAASQPVRGTLNAHIDNLALLAALSPELGAPSGAIDATVELAGTLAAPALRGRITLAHGGFDLAPLGVSVEHVALEARFAPDGEIKVQGSAHSGPGRIKVEGSGRLESAERWQARLHVSGTGVEAVDTPDARVLVSPDLQLAVQGRQLEVEGEVKVPEAKIHPRKLATGVETVSPDVVIVGTGAGPPPPPWKLAARIHLVLGDKVSFEGFGLSAKLGGDLHLAETPGSIATGRGRLEIRDGTYRAFGQDLKISQGRLLFAGGPVDDPALDVRATRAAGSVSAPVTAGVQVSGTVNNPVLSLFSTPPMSQADALSYLLTGHALSSASAAEGQLLYGAASSLGFSGGNLLAEHIAATFGLQEARIETGSTLRQSSLVLGKYLSPRLYVKYSMGLAGAVNQLRIRYELSKRWVLETETGLQGGADLLYTLER